MFPFVLRKQLPSGYLSGMIAGAAVGFTRLHPEWAPLQIPALALFGWDLAREKAFFPSLRPGFWFGLALAGVALSKIRVDIASTAILFVALTAYWTLLGAGMSYFLRRGDFRGVWAAAGLLTLGEWSQIHVLPLFGTAQRIAAAWVDSAMMLPFARLGGTTAIMFVVALVAFFAAVRVHESGLGKRSLLRIFAGSAAAACVTAVLFVFCCAGEFLPGQQSTFKVAVCGAKDGTSAFLPPALFEKKFGAMVAEAAGKGARLVVTPELALDVSPQQRDAVLEKFASDAQRLGVVWVLGFSEGGHARPGSLNRSVILNAGRPVGEIYDKTHWVDFMERYAKVGDAKPPSPVMDLHDCRLIRVGTMICQDDNFENVSRYLSLSEVGVVGVPTWDWPGVAEAHLDSSRNRPREFGFTEARAALGGTSAIIDPAGRILASRNHLSEGDGVVIASVDTMSRSSTPFARFGDWPTLALAGLGVFCGVFRRKQQVPPPGPAGV